MWTRELGEMDFKVGFKKEISLPFLGKDWEIILKFQAYKDSDGLTGAQETAWHVFSENREKLLKEAAKALLKKYPGADKQFLPSELLFKRDGSCAVLLSAVNGTEDDLAVTIIPEVKVMFQDEYL